jgi:hypothetical protein
LPCCNECTTNLHPPHARLPGAFTFIDRAHRAHPYKPQTDLTPLPGSFGAARQALRPPAAPPHTVPPGGDPPPTLDAPLVPGGQVQLLGARPGGAEALQKVGGTEPQGLMGFGPLQQQMSLTPRPVAPGTPSAQAAVWPQAATGPLRIPRAVALPKAQLLQTTAPPLSMSKVCSCSSRALAVPLAAYARPVRAACTCARVPCRCTLQ